MSTANRGINIGPPRFKIAVHSIVWLAKCGGILSSAMIASQVQSHATFMRRIMNVLACAGVVESRGGRDGGYSLRKCPNEITLGEVYSAVRIEIPDPHVDIDCGEEGEWLDLELEKILLDAEQQTISYLNQFTIADVIARLDNR